jgi:hypothetical protein
MRKGFLRLEKEKGQITNALGEVLFVRRKRAGKEVYVAPSTETAICRHVSPKEVWVCVKWEGPQCRSWEECSSREVMEVEICVDFAIPEPGGASREPWRPIEGVATLRP